MFLVLLFMAGLGWQAVSPEVVQHVRAGMDAQKQGHLPEAISEFKTVTELAPELPAAFVNLGAAYLQNRQYEEAIAPLRRALAMNPSLVGAEQMLGVSLLAQGYASEAIPYLEKTKTVDALGIAQLKAGKLPEAVSSLRAALEQRPDDPDLLYYFGRATGLLSKSTFDALEANFAKSARAHQALAEAYVALQRNAEAEGEYQQALQARPDAPGIHLGLGQLYTKVAAWSKAEEQFRAERRLQPGDAEAAYDLGQALLQEGKAQEAQGELKHADELRPGMPETLYLLGKASSQAGHSAEAEAAWRDLLQQEGHGKLAAQAHFGLATLYRKQGKKAEAEAEMEQFRKAESGR